MVEDYINPYNLFSQNNDYLLQTEEFYLLSLIDNFDYPN